MMCPRCRAEVNARPDAAGLIVCPACKVQLKMKNPESMPKAPAGNVTLPPGVRPPVPMPWKTQPPFKAPQATAEPSPTAAPPPPAPAASPPTPSPRGATSSLDDVMSELKALRGLQMEILSMLKAIASGSPPPAASPSEADDSLAPSPPPPVRSRHRKTVLLIDDEEPTRKAAVAALQQAEVPVRAVADGNAGLEAMAADRPDVVVLELGLAGRMAGKDVVNMIKATMEWVDIPIVLYTRIPVENQKEARITHGADELILKGSGAPEALCARVIAIFRRS